MKGLYGDCTQQLGQSVLQDESENGAEMRDASPELSGGRKFRASQVGSLAIRNTSSYDTMERPFRPDKLRGRWSKSADFYFASSSYAFSTMVFSDAPVWGLMFGGWKYYLAAYLLAVCFHILPVFLIQTFLGQFSTSGAISAFRVSPIFKGIGYSILLLNLGTLSYYCVNAALPLIYAINSLQDVMPWLSCNNTWNTESCSTHDYYDTNMTASKTHSTVEFFGSVIGSNVSGLSLSIYMCLSVIGIWLLVLALLLTRISIVGKFMRCACVLMFGFFLAVFVYLVIHEQVDWDRLGEYLHPAIDSWVPISSALGTAIMQASIIMGPGWGSIITLGSYNSFRTDAERMSIWVAVTNVLITVMSLVCGHVANDHFEDHVGMWNVEKKHNMQFLYLAYSYLFGSFTTLPKLWSFLFFAVIFLAEFCALIIQMLTVLTALFDEFEQLRHKKPTVTILLVTLLMATSIYFCTSMGFNQVSALSYIALFTQIIISAVLLLMTTWIYGRVRFQCDLQFMLGKTIASFKVFFIRFITPGFIGISLWQTLYMLTTSGGENALIWTSQILIYVFAFGYMLNKLCRTNGTWRQRFRQCLAPHDWHPVNTDNRRFYEEIMGTSEMLVIVP